MAFQARRGRNCVQSLGGRWRLPVAGALEKIANNLAGKLAGKLAEK
jgi:hypothetical protein